MRTTVIHAGRILTPEEEITDGIIVVEGSKIAALGHRDEIRLPPDAVDYVAGGMTVVPGFVDVHIHGAGGHDVMEANARALDRISTTVARHGTTSLVATTITAPVDDTCRSLQGIARYIRAQRRPKRFPAIIRKTPSPLLSSSAFISKVRSSAKRVAVFILRIQSRARPQKCCRNSSTPPMAW